MSWEYLIYRKIILYIECDLIADTHTHTDTHPATHRTLERSRLEYQQYLPPLASETTSDFNFLLYKQLSNYEFKRQEDTLMTLMICSKSFPSFLQVIQDLLHFTGRLGYC